MGVEPILDYFSSIWYNDINTCKAATNVFNRAHCYYIGLPVHTAVAGMHREMGWMHPRYMQFLNMICLYNRSLEMGKNQISKQVLYCDMNWPAGWMQAFRERCLEYRLLDPVRFGFALPVDLAYGKCMCEQHQEELWQEEMTNKPKLRILAMVKSTYEPEQYLKNHTKKGLWALFAQLRLGSLPLSVEEVHFAGLHLDQRICPLCMEHNLVEDEYHFLMVCEEYETERRELLGDLSQYNDNFPNLDDVEKFIYILKLGNKRSMEHIYRCWWKRKSKIYMQLGGTRWVLREMIIKQHIGSN